MAMATRLRTKKIQENFEPTELVETGKMQADKQALGDAAEKRKAFGNICNRIGSGASKSQEDKQKPTAGYKDVKPRVDTRWKKDVAAPPQRSRVTAAVSTLQEAAKPVLRQASKPKLVHTESAPNVLAKKPLVKLSSLIETKKDSRNRANNEMQIIRSPGSFKFKTEKIEHTQKNFYESHSTKLLHQIENIDENDGDNPQLLAEYVNDIYAYMFKLEKTFTIRDNFLANQMDVTPKMRSVLLDWINEVHTQFSLELETYHMTVSMIDRYLQAFTNTPRRYLQLVGVAALFMASKYEELMPPEITDFVYVTDDTYSKEQILQMEKKVFTALGFNLSKPLPIHFLRRFAKAAGALGDRQYIAAKYFMELATVDYEMTKFKPSQVAAASLFLSLHVLNTIKSDKDLWTPTLEHYSTYSSEDLMPVTKRLATIVAAAKETKLKSVFTKYSHASYKFTSTLPEMSGIKMHDIINR